MNRRVATVFVDALFLVLLVLVLLPHADEGRTNAGTLVFQAAWADGSRADVDMWVKTPGDDPVGYYRLRGANASLFRDEIGTSKRASRDELVATFDVPDGEYILNLFLYSDEHFEAPLEVVVEVWLNEPGSRSKRNIWSGRVTLKARYDEETAVRFRIEDGAPVWGSINATPYVIFGDDRHDLGLIP